MQGILELAGVFLAMASPFLVWVFLAEWFRYKREMRQQLSEINKEMAELDVKTLKQELELQKERIAVLEAIVTEEKFELNQKIGALK